MRVTDVRINQKVNPVGYSFSTKRISWKIEEADTEIILTRIEVAEDAQFQNLIYVREEDDLDQTGENLRFAAEPRTRYFVRVIVTGSDGETAESDGRTFFETAKMSEPWSGKWIAPQKGDSFHPLFEKSFPAEKEVKAARLYISGLGLYYACLNGKAVTDEILTPYYSDYHTEVQYQTYDITGLLQDRNQLTVTLGDGWYKGKFGLARKENNFGDAYMLLAEIHICYADGTEDVIGTDESWQYKGSDLVSSSIYDGEVINHQLWDEKENPWRRPVFTMPEGKLVERYTIPVRPEENMPVREIIHTPVGETVLDFGQNFAGYVSFRACIPAGSRVVLDFGEILQDGNFYNANYRDAKSQFVYISDGREECVQPHFTYFGFRYCRVKGWPGEIHETDFMGHAVYSELRQTGFIETGNAKVNRLFRNVLWGQKSNFVDLATDCPQRDERLGWTGDAQVFAGTASYNMDTAAFYEGFLHDLRTEQQKYDGILPGVIPVLDPNGPIFSAIWGDIATFLPAVLYEHYGDKTALRQNYPMMKDWVDKIAREDKKRGAQYLFNFSNQLGDWLALDGRTEQSNEGATDAYYIASCYWAESVRKVADAAAALGYTDDEAEYRKLYEQILDAIHHEYYTPSGRLAIDTQTGYIVALYTKTYPDKERVISGLRKRLYKDCYKIRSGFCGAPIMCRVMAENGMQEEAVYFLTQSRYPGWLHCIDLGATTIWERWNSVLDDGHLSGTMMNSLNHYAFGAVAEFLYRDIAGLKALEPGFRKAEISPVIDHRLGYMRMSYESPYGRWESNWEIRKDGSVSVMIRVPACCTALVRLPFYPDSENIGEVGTGVHTYMYQPTKNLLKRYNRHTLFLDMMQDPEAMRIIKDVSPLLHWFLKTGNEDFYYENLETIAGMSYMGFREEEIAKLEEELCSLRCK